VKWLRVKTKDAIDAKERMGVGMTVPEKNVAIP
jgi:hypothetical protein